jgi:hypothetical protein
MRKRFWTLRKNKYKHRTRKQKKPRHKNIKRSRRNMVGGEMPFSGISLGSLTNSISNPMNTYIPPSGKVISTPYVWNQFNQTP